MNKLLRGKFMFGLDMLFDFQFQLPGAKNTNGTTLFHGPYILWQGKCFSVRKTTKIKNLYIVS